MGLTSTSFLVVLAVVAVAAPAAAVLGWNRVGGRAGVRWVARFGILVVVEVTGCLLLAVVLNDANQFYPSWSELFGSAGKLTSTSAHTGALDRTLRKDKVSAGQTAQSRIVSVSVPVADQKTSISAEVYLPAAYFEPPYAQRQFPVVELLDGFPGSPQAWLHPQSLDVQGVLDTEFDSGRANPFVAVMPEQNFQGAHDGECIDAVGGTKVETTLVQNVRDVIYRDFRVGRSAGYWSVMGYSTGGYCATNIVMRHPGLFGSAVSLEGYTRPYTDYTTGDIFGPGHAYRDANNPLWMLRHQEAPPVSLLLAYCDGDRESRLDALRFAAADRAPLNLSLLHMPGGAHNFPTVRLEEPVAVDWVSRHLVAPLAPSVGVRGHVPVDVRPKPDATDPTS